jgi:hypothetical protein
MYNRSRFLDESMNPPEAYIVETPRSACIVFPPNLVHSGTGDYETAHAAAAADHVDTCSQIPIATTPRHKCSFDRPLIATSKIPENAIVSIYLQIGSVIRVQSVLSSQDSFPVANSIFPAAEYADRECTPGDQPTTVRNVKILDGTSRNFEKLYEECYSNGRPNAPAQFKVDQSDADELRRVIIGSISPEQIQQLEAIWVHQKVEKPTRRSRGRGRGSARRPADHPYAKTQTCYGSDPGSTRWILKMNKEQQQATIEFLKKSLHGQFTCKPELFNILIRFPNCSDQQLHSDYRR